MITRTVGSGGDYANFAAAINAIDAAGGLTNNTKLLQISDVNEDIPHVGDLNCNGYTLYLDSNNPHRGNPNSGHTIYLTTINTGLKISADNTINVRNLKIKNTVIPSSYFTFLNIDQPLSSGSFFVDNILIVGLNRSQERGLRIGRNSSYYRATNIKIYNCGDCGFLGDYSGVRYAGEFRGRKTIENMTVYNCGRSGGSYRTGIFLKSDNRPAWPNSAYNHTCRNVVSVNGGVNGDYYFKDSLPITGDGAYDMLYNCADSDGSLIANANLKDGLTVEDQVGNITPADEFESLDDTNDRFLFLPRGKKYGNMTAAPTAGRKPLKVQFNSAVRYDELSNRLAKGGTKPLYAGNTDIAGVSRPAGDGSYSIGCHQCEYQCTDVEI